MLSKLDANIISHVNTAHLGDGKTKANKLTFAETVDKLVYEIGPVHDGELAIKVGGAPVRTQADLRECHDLPIHIDTIVDHLEVQSVDGEIRLDSMRYILRTVFAVPDNEVDAHLDDLIDEEEDPDHVSYEGFAHLLQSVFYYQGPQAFLDIESVLMAFSLEAHGLE